MNKTLKDHLHQLEENLLKPETRSSKTELTRILAEGFFEIGSSGKILYQDQEISEEGIGLVKMTMDHFEVQALSDEIVLTTYRIFNEETHQHSLRSSIWKWADERWQMVFHQGTRVS
ncbi:nuclear transport factor 2 family protein [Rossellomorea sp. LJF3]|uniref:nuclear transport factor 2 family protein n=1 Tax=Rossellomorea sp. LJF3 TaxID=3126099 RepID=UPI00300C814A